MLRSGNGRCLSIFVLAAATWAVTSTSYANEAQTTTADHPAMPLTAQQALEHLLQFIRDNRQVSTVTAESMRKAFQIPVKVVNQDYFGYGQPLPDHWAFSIERQNIGSEGPRIDFTFGPRPGHDDAPARAICQPDFKQFTARLEGQGFTRDSIYGEHGRWLMDRFERDGMSVEVYPLSNVSKTGEPLGPHCVQMVLIR